MRVRLRIKPLKSEGNVVETSAVANAGYESGGPEMILPRPVAKRIGLLPRPPEGARIEEYRAVDRKVRLLYVPGGVEVKLLAEAREKGPIIATAVIAKGETEVLMSDKLIDALEIDLVKAGEGLWRLSDDPPGMIRRSVPPEEW